MARADRLTVKRVTGFGVASLVFGALALFGGHATASVGVTSAGTPVVLPGVDTLPLPDGITDPVQVLVADAAGVAIATSECADCTADWPVPTNLGLKGGHQYQYTVQICTSDTCTNVGGASDFEVSPAYCRPVTVISDMQDPAGGHVLAYEVDGHQLHQRVAPPGFSPLRATPDELQRYGFPPRPAPPTDDSQWVARFAGYTHSVATPPCIMDALEAIYPTNPSANWSGPEAYFSSGSAKYTQVDGEFYQPAREPTSCASPYTASFWVGLGGDQVSPLLQTGTEMDYQSSTIWPWYEEISSSFDTGMLKFNQETWNAGNLIYVDTFYDPSTHEADFDNYNESLGSYLSAYDTSASSFWNGSTAEAISERTSFYISGAWKYPHLEKFGAYSNVRWTQAHAWDSTGGYTYLRSRSHVDVYMTNRFDSTQLASVSTTNPGWYDNWHACGNVENRG